MSKPLTCASTRGWHATATRQSARPWEASDAKRATGTRLVRAEVMRPATGACVVCGKAGRLDGSTP
eukprot:1829357-Pleurochrysis_carterae.AAC.1